MRWPLALVVLAACRPHPTTQKAAETRAETCEGCHRAEAGEWRGSMHAVAFTSADFQHSYKVEHEPYCADCHATTETSGCTTCHDGHKGTKSCVSCHDFDVPRTQAILQSTEREHRESAFAATPCTGCHAGHRMSVSRNPALLGKAIGHRARLDGRNIVVELSAQGVGHRFPTGDIYRRLTVVVTGYDAAGNLIAGETFHLARDWDEHRKSLADRTRPEPREDTRLDDKPRELRVGASERPVKVHLTVTYERGSGAAGELFDAFEKVDIVDADEPLR